MNILAKKANGESATSAVALAVLVLLVDVVEVLNVVVWAATKPINVVKMANGCILDLEESANSMSTCRGNVRTRSISKSLQYFLLLSDTFGLSGFYFDLEIFNVEGMAGQYITCSNHLNIMPSLFRVSHVSIERLGRYSASG